MKDKQFPSCSQLDVSLNLSVQSGLKSTVRVPAEVSKGHTLSTHLMSSEGQRQTTRGQDSSPVSWQPMPNYMDLSQSFTMLHCHHEKAFLSDENRVEPCGLLCYEGI